MNTSHCPRCKGSFALDQGGVTLRDQTYHKKCGLLELWSEFQRPLRASVKRRRSEMEQRLGKFERVRHPPPPAEVQPAHICKEAGLIHAGPNRQHIRISTHAVLLGWYNQHRSRAERSFRACAGWDINRTMRYLGDMLEATTVAYDNLRHSITNQPNLRYADNAPAVLVFVMRNGLKFGMTAEVGQYAAHCCTLALKTLYAIHNLDAEPQEFKDIGHDISQVWDKLEGEKGFLIDIMRNMPVFPVAGAIDEPSVRTALVACANFDDLRFYELSGCRLQVSPETHLRLAWAAYLRCKALVADNPTPSPQRKKTKVSRDTPSSLMQKPSRDPNANGDARLRHGRKYLNGDSTVLPDWLRLAMLIGPIGGYNSNTLQKTRYGLIHTPSNEYLCGSTSVLLLAWTFERGARFFDPELENTGLGDVTPLVHTLHGRLEEITTNYATNTSLMDVHTIDGEPLKDYFMGQFLLHTQASVFACELTLKWLYAIVHPDAPLRYYTKTHDVLRLWNRIEDHHDNVLDVFHSMPLFQADGPAHKREQVSAEKLCDLLGRFRTAYVDARYGITDPSRKVLEITDDYRITLHLAWAVFIYGLQSIIHRGHESP